MLRYLGETGAGVGVSRVARDLELNPSTCFNLLRTLVHEGMVDFDPHAKTYTLGLGVVELAKGALEQTSYARFMRPHLEAIAARHGVTATLWQRTGKDRVVLVDRCEADSAMRVHMQIGQRLPLGSRLAPACPGLPCTLQGVETGQDRGVHSTTSPRSAAIACTVSTKTSPRCT